jgi:hypothetical protein
LQTPGEYATDRERRISRGKNATESRENPNRQLAVGVQVIACDSAPGCERQEVFFCVQN